jgi:4-carboxymuconolactone decarboxylase
VARIPIATRDAVPENERAAYDEFMSKREGRPNTGPYSLLLHMPVMAQHLETLRLYLRDEASLAPKLQELVMLTVAREMNCSYIWYAHAPTARQAGVRDAIVDALRDREPLLDLESEEAIAVQVAQELIRNRKLGQATFEEATKLLGQRGMMTLVNLIACYAVLAYNMNAYELEAPQHPTEPALPMSV